MGHTNVRFKDVPACMHIKFEFNETSKVILEAYLEAGNYKMLADKLEMLGVEIWLPSWSSIGNIGPEDSVLLCKKDMEEDRLGDGTLWLPDAQPAPGEDPRVCADKCTRGDGNKDGCKYDSTVDDCRNCIKACVSGNAFIYV